MRTLILSLKALTAVLVGALVFQELPALLVSTVFEFAGETIQRLADFGQAAEHTLTQRVVEGRP